MFTLDEKMSDGSECSSSAESAPFRTEETSRGIDVLIVEHVDAIAELWSAFLRREGAICTIVSNAEAAYDALRLRPYAAVVLDMELPRGEALEIADFASYRIPEVPIIAVSARGFFSDSMIFDLVPNARGLLRAPPRLDDMAAMVHHYGIRSPLARD